MISIQVPVYVDLKCSGRMGSDLHEEHFCFVGNPVIVSGKSSLKMTGKSAVLSPRSSGHWDESRKTHNTKHA